jgi:hypothetical protein
MERVILNKLTKLTTILLLLAFFTFQMTAWADTTAAGNTLNISLTIGKREIMINTNKLDVEAPYITKDGSTVIPLRVITTAFGAVLTYDAATKTIGLKYNEHTLSLTIDNKLATVDGKTIEMNTAPQLHNGTTMVPVRFIADNFGAKTTFNNVTKEITITGDAPTVDSTSGLNNDVGKTKIGDSYNNWTMKYPTGLVKTFQSFKGTIVDFSDANSEFTLHVNILNSDVQDMSPEALLKDLSEYVTDTILNKTTVTENGKTYAKVISKNKAGQYNETRSFYSKGKIYYLVLDVEKEANFVNPIKYANYKELLDSFIVSYDNKDFTIKDLSTAKNGYRNYTSDDYGFSVNIPADWYKADEKGSRFNFYSDFIANQEVVINVSSLAAGDTLDAWITRENLDYANTFAQSFGSLTSSKDIQINGINAKDNFYIQTINGKSTIDESIYLVSGNLKYNIDFMYPKDASVDDIKTKRESFISSFTITNKLNPALGFISDNKENKNNKLKIINKEYKLSFEIPEIWSENTKAEQADGSIDYDFAGGGLSILMSDQSKDIMSAHMEKSIRNVSTTRINSITDTTIAGFSARKFDYTSTENNKTFNEIMFIFGDNTKSYMVIYTINEAFATPFNLKKIEDVITSIQAAP